MAFDRLATKFQILKNKLKGRLTTKSSSIISRVRLHNFVIDVDFPEIINEPDDIGEDQIVAMPNVPRGVASPPMMIENE